MSLSQVDRDYLIIREKVLSENETFLKKFQANKDYMDYKTKNKHSLFWPIFVSFLLIGLIASCIYFSQKYFPQYFIYEFVSGLVLVLLIFTFLIAILAKKLKEERALNKKGFYNAVLTIEKCYDNLTYFMSTSHPENLSDKERLNFYQNLGKIFGNTSSKLSKIYSYKTRNLTKLQKSDLDWHWLTKYLYNFGKFCYNKKKDCKSFVSLINL